MKSRSTHTAKPVMQGSNRLLAHDELLNLLHLGHMVLIGLQFPLTDPLIDPNQCLPGNIFTIIHTSEVLDKVLQLHLALRLDIGAVHVCVEQDDREGQDEDGVWVPELPYHPRVADTVPLAGRIEN